MSSGNEEGSLLLVDVVVHLPSPRTILSNPHESVEALAILGRHVVVRAADRKPAASASRRFMVDSDEPNVSV